MIVLLLLLARALAEDAAPAEAGEAGDIDPEVVEQVTASLWNPSRRRRSDITRKATTPPIVSHGQSS